MDLNLYEKLSYTAIERWERRPPSGLGKKILDFTSKPVDLLLKFASSVELDEVNQAVHSSVNRMLHSMHYSAKPERLIKRARAHGITITHIEDLKQCNLRLLDRCNRKHIDFHQTVATVQGALFGLANAWLAIVDLLSVLLEIFHLSQEVAYCYGFDPNNNIEKEIMIRALQAGIGGAEMKKKCLEEIATLKNMADQPKNLQPSANTLSVLGSKALKEYVERMVAAVLVRIIPHCVPVIAVVAGAHNNREMVQQVGKTMFYVYRKRFIERKEGLVSTISIQAD